MSHGKLLQVVIGVILVILFAVGCGGVPTATPVAEAPAATPTPVPSTATNTPEPPTATPVPPTASPTPESHVEGSLLNKDTGEPLAGARVILCPKGAEEAACVIDAYLTSVTDSGGQFNISGVRSGEYVVLYNASGEIRPEWDGMKLQYSPVVTSGDPGSGNVGNLMRSLGVSSLSNCEAYLNIIDGNLVVAGGYLYADSADLAFILVNGDLVYVTVQDGLGRIDLRGWDTKNEGGCEGEFDPLR